jgi:hypothetical protein
MQSHLVVFVREIGRFRIKKFNSINRKELSYGKDSEKKEEQGCKGGEVSRLFLLNLWEGYKNTLASLFARQSRKNLHLRILQCFYRRSSACMRSNGDRDEVCL